ncbi:hypothetical protein [Psychroserpens luteolus]|uniref:hypothetical protein n=1 Tax=Psychroserpens luteolus TaxID=2855840 RepID=UPI001E4FDCBF|nr:hypothetical protein [Psychroserpens luteolus]MCD2260875.1 hypothetical protein [Psychroserpens luteolus]
MKKITILALCMFTVNISVAQLDGGGSTVFRVNNDNPNAGPIARITGIGLSPSYQSLGDLFGLNTIYNGYGRNFRAIDHRNFSLDRSLDARWRRARIFINGLPNIFSARYNPIFDKVEIKDQDNIYNLIKTENVEITFLDTNQTYIVKSYTDDKGYEALNYFLLDTDVNGYELLKRDVYTHIINKRSKNKIKLKKSEQFYIMHDDKLVALSTKKKTIKKDFPENAKLILAFIKKNKLKKDKKDHLKLLANYITSLNLNSIDKTMLASN